jgi:transposase
MDHRRGDKKAVVAMAYNILVIAYHVLRNQSYYRELGADYFDRLNVTHLKWYHLRRLANLGFKFTVEPLKQAA